MGKQNKGWAPPEDDLIDGDTVEQKPAATWAPPETDAVVEPVKKKDESSVKTDPSGSDSVTPGEPSSKSGASNYQAIGDALKVVHPIAKPIFDLGRRILSGFTDDIPKATAQALEVAKSSVSPANVQEFIKTQKPIDFQKYVREKEGIKWYQGFDIDKHIAKHADGFMADTGLQDVAQRITENRDRVIARRQGVETFAAEQKQDAATKMAGAVQDYRDIKSIDDVASFVATMGGQAAYQIPLAIATRGASSLLQESAEVYDQQIDNIAEDKGISRAQVIEQNLDEPARGQAYAILAASLDAASAGNLLKIFRQGAKDGVMKRWIKGVVPEVITEPTQGVLETVGGATGDKLEAAGKALKDPARVNEALGALIGGSAGVFGASPKQTVEAVTQNVDVTDEQNLAAKAEVIQQKVEAEEGTVAAGNTDLQPTTPINAQTTPVASFDEQVQSDPIVSEDQAQEEVQTQGDQEVAPPGVEETPAPAQDINAPQTQYTPEQPDPKQAAREQVESLVQSGDLKREDNGKVTVLTEKGGAELRRIVDENKINYTVVDPNIERSQPESATQPQTLYDDAQGESPVGLQAPENTEGAPEAPTSPDGVTDQGGASIDDPQTGDRRTEEEVAPPRSEEPAPVSPQQTAGATITQTPEERTTYTRIKNDPSVSKAIKQGISKEAKKYIPRGLKKVTEYEADAIISAKGTDESVKMYLDDTNQLYPDVDTTIGIKLFDKLQQEGNTADAIRVFEKLSIRGTELGQAVNAYKLMQGKTMIGVVQKSITKARQKYKEKIEGTAASAKSEIDKITNKAVEQVLKSPKFQTKVASEVKKGSVKKAIDFLEGLKVDTKGKALDVVYGVSAAAWNTVITAVQKGLQAGLTISQAINKAVGSVKDPAFKKTEATTYLDENLKDYRVSLDPQRAIKAELAATGKKIDDIIRSHYSEQESTKKELIEKLIADGNVSADQAQAITDELSAEFDRLTRDAKQKALNRLLPKESKNVTRKDRQDTVNQLIEQSNLGALSEENFAEAITEKLGVPKLSEQQLKEVQDLTDAVQKAKGDTAKSKAAQDLLNYIENLKGWTWMDAVQSVWYANILSGPTTWLVTNPFANLTNLIAELGIDIVQHPKDAAFIIGRVATGLTRGLIQAGDVLSTGYTPYKGEDYKTEATPLLERIRFKGGKINPLNWLKYVTRAIKAGDIIFYHPLKEQRLAVLAMKEARKHGRTSPNKEDMHNLREQLIKEDYDKALEQATTEGFKGREAKIRAYEILESTRPEFTTKEAEQFAARATFNIKPEGTLGQLAEVINSARRKFKPLNYIMPFVNTIMNVANEYANYNPVVGFTRVIKGSYGWNSESTTYRKLTNEERAKIAIKSTIGSMFITALTLLDDPDDEDGMFEITANGTGDIIKNYELERSGWRPYSFRIGKTWINYKNTPMALPFATVGFMKDAARYRKDPNIKEEISILTMGSFRFMMDMSTLSGLSDFFEIFSKEDISQYGSSAEKLVKNVEKIAKSILVPNYFTQMSRLIQEFTDSPVKRADDLGESIYRDVPILRDNLDHLYDAFGDPVVPKQLEKLIPLNTHRTPEDAEMFEFLKDKKLLVGKPSKDNLKPNGTPMTEKEYNDWALSAAKAIKGRLKREYKMYTREKNKEVIKDWFDRVKQEERRNSKYETFGFF